MPASTPNRAATISMSSVRNGSTRSATTARAGASSSSPAPITPPPTAITCGLKMLIRLASTTPSREPISVIASIADSSPS